MDVQTPLNLDRLGPCSQSAVVSGSKFLKDCQDADCCRVLILNELSHTLAAIFKRQHAAPFEGFLREGKNVQESQQAKREGYCRLSLVIQS